MTFYVVSRAFLGYLLVALAFAAEPAQIMRMVPDQGVTVLVGKEADIRLVVNLADQHQSHDHILVASAKDGEGVVRILASEWLDRTGNQTDPNGAHVVRLLGLHPGRAALDFFLDHMEDTNHNRSERAIKTGYPVQVVDKINVIQDAFLYVVLTSEFLVLLLLAFRMRTDAVKEVFLQPKALLSALVCQAVLMPLVALGLAKCFSLSAHSAVCLLLIGCCPSGFVAPLASVLQQAHVELSLVVNLLQTATAFGLMPLWLYAYSSFLQLPAEDGTGPYLYLALALAVMVAPVLVGIIGHRWAPVDLAQMDHLLLPSCLLVLLVDVAVKASNIQAALDLLSSQTVLGSVLLPICGGLLGALVTGGLRQPFTKIKSAAISTAVQNTVLAKVVVQCSYSEAEANVMSLTLACVDVVTLTVVMVLYLLHIVLWIQWPYYRPLHKNTGLGSLDHTALVETFLQQFIKKKGNRLSNPKPRSPAKKTIQRTLSTPTGKCNLAVNTLGSLTGRMMLQQSPVDMPPKLDGTVSSNIFRHYLASPEQSPVASIHRSEKDSLAGIDYDMLNGQKVPRQESMPSEERSGVEDDYQKMMKSRSQADNMVWSMSTHSRSPSETNSHITTNQDVFPAPVSRPPSNLWIDADAKDRQNTDEAEHIYDKPIRIGGSETKQKKVFGENIYIVNAPNDITFEKPEDSPKMADRECKVYPKTPKQTWSPDKFSGTQRPRSAPASPASEFDSGVSDVKEEGRSLRGEALVLDLDVGGTRCAMNEWVRFSGEKVSPGLDSHDSMDSHSTSTEENFESSMSIPYNSLSRTYTTEAEDTDVNYCSMGRDRAI